MGLSADMNEAAIMWLAFVELSVPFHEVVLNRSRPQTTSLPMERLKQLAAGMNDCFDGVVVEGLKTPSAPNLPGHILRLHQQYVDELRPTCGCSDHG